MNARSVGAYTLTGFLIPGTLVVLTGDMVSWVTGGYDGELSKAVATLVQSVHGRGDEKTRLATEFVHIQIAD